MRTLVLLVILAVVCKGDHWKYRRLIDLLQTQALYAEKRHEVTAGKRHEVTAAKRHEVTADKRHAVTADKRHEVTASIRAVQPHDATSPPVYAHALMEHEFSGIQEAFLFPGSHYLIDMIRKHCESGLGLTIGKDEITDQFQHSYVDARDLRRMMRVIEEVEDPKGVALLMIRLLTKPLLDARMKCPATILDMGIVKSLLNQKEKFMEAEDNSLFTFFKKMAPLIDPRLEDFADDIAAAAVHELHGTVFNETMEFLWQYGLKDLAYASHEIFHHVHYFFVDVVRDMDYVDREADLQRHMSHGTTLIKCPTSAEVIEYHEKEVKRFRTIFSLMETEQVCLKAADFINMYVSTALPGYVPNLQNNIHFDELCEGIKLTIDDIVQGYADYEDFLFTMKTGDLKLVLSELLSNEEWTLVEEALRRLNFTD